MALFGTLGLGTNRIKVRLYLISFKCKGFLEPTGFQVCIAHDKKVSHNIQ